VGFHTQFSEPDFRHLQIIGNSRGSEAIERAGGLTVAPTTFLCYRAPFMVVLGSRLSSPNAPMSFVCASSAVLPVVEIVAWLPFSDHSYCLGDVGVGVTAGPVGVEVQFRLPYRLSALCHMLYSLIVLDISVRTRPSMFLERPFESPSLFYCL
jgi:hypothetical protein